MVKEVENPHLQTRKRKSERFIIIIIVFITAAHYITIKFSTFEDVITKVVKESGLLAIIHRLISEMGQLS